MVVSFSSRLFSELACCVSVPGCSVNCLVPVFSGLFSLVGAVWAPSLFCFSFCWSALLAGPGCFLFFVSLVVNVTPMLAASGWPHVESLRSPPVLRARWNCLCLCVVVVFIPVVCFPPVWFAFVRFQVPVSVSVSGPVCLVWPFLSVYLLRLALSEFGRVGGLSATSYCLCLSNKLQTFHSKMFYQPRLLLSTDLH